LEIRPKLKNRHGVQRTLTFEVLNVSFSLESMISAFAITNDVIFIILSLIINTIKNLKISIC
ncbi:DUF475 domain-containing protein, partial [Acinetobacter sp.]|uniref:DUF475 domain-containing protein n=1 Tax=Acinetobacter sp. TaxID=472 RepID=UPI0028A64A76